MNAWSRIGIVDIGSNSIRLVIYEYNEQNAHRVLGEWKESARLSARIGADGVLRENDIISIVPILKRFCSICETHGARRVRAAATAAIRNAANAKAIVETLRQRTDLAIDVLSGEEEGRLGFIGAINTLDLSDGFLVDIGGGSTEVTLFKNRRLLHSVSFPFGAVNTTLLHTSRGNVTDEQIRSIRSMVEQAVAKHEWIASSPGLPLVALGGTARTLGKLDQKRRKYSLGLSHNYGIAADNLNELARWLPSLPLDKRKKIDGLSKDRADIIVPGIIIAQTLFQLLRAKAYIVSGAGLRDGLFYEAIAPEQPIVGNVLESSLRNLLALHTFIPVQHVRHVERLALKLFDDLQPAHGLDYKARRNLSVAAQLYRLGSAVHYYQYNRHTFYMMAYSRIDGLSHRDILLSAAIASYKTKSRIRQLLLNYRDIVAESDDAALDKLGTLLQVAIALDKSETQPIAEAEARAEAKTVRIKLLCCGQPSLELKELNSVDKEFAKAWNAKLEIELASDSCAKP